MQLERCPGSGLLVALGQKQSHRDFAGCPVCLRPIELIPKPPGQASPWGIIAEHERRRADDAKPPPDAWPADMPATAVLAVLAALDEARVDAWVAGGWAVDSLVFEQTRPHRDLDLAVRAEHVDVARSALHGLGYDLERDLRPVRLVVATPEGRSVDLHPVTFGADGIGRQPGDDGRVFDYPSDAFGTGRIDGIVVPSLTAIQLVRFHLGYEPQQHDRQDMATLHARLGIEIPPPY
jgi:lincosamide nucleotidyltransferase A/C/D/E